MEIVLLVLKIALLLVAAVMTFFILLQEGKGGGLAALGGTKAAGVEGVTNPIRRATAYLAGIFFILAIAIGFFSRNSSSLTGPEQVAEPGMASGPGLKPNSTDLPLSSLPQFPTLPNLPTLPTLPALPTLLPQTPEGPAKTEALKTDEAQTGAEKTSDVQALEAPKPVVPVVEVKTPEPAKTGEVPAK